MATYTRAVGKQFTYRASVAATNPASIALDAPASDQKTVIDSITVSYVGTVQTSANLHVDGAAVRWEAQLVGPAAGLGSFHLPFPSGMSGLPNGEQVSVIVDALANCAIKLSVTGHQEPA